MVSFLFPLFEKTELGWRRVKVSTGYLHYSKTNLIGERVFLFTFLRKILLGTWSVSTGVDFIWRSDVESLSKDFFTRKSRQVSRFFTESYTTAEKTSFDFLYQKTRLISLFVQGVDHQNIDT